MWTSLSVSLLGDRFTTLALPTTAILVLHANTFTVGLLAMCGELPDLLSMVGGAIADRWERRRLLLVCNLAAALAVGSVPLAAALGHLAMGVLFAAAAVEGVAALLAFLTFYALLPPVVGRPAFSDANARLEASGAVTRVIGPGLAGFAIQALGAARAMVFDALSFIFAALVLSRIRNPAAGRGQQTTTTLGRDIADGVRLVFLDRQLRRLAFCSGTGNFAAGMGLAVYLVFLYRQAGMTPGEIGAIATGVAVISPLVTFNTPRILARVPTATVLIASALGFSASWLLLPLATHVNPAAIFALAWGLSVLAGSVWNVSMVTLRQAFTPDGMFGRMVAATKTVATGATPLGSLAGGVLGARIGVPATLLIAGVIGIASAGFLLDRALLNSRVEPVAQTA